MSDIKKINSQQNKEINYNNNSVKYSYHLSEVLHENKKIQNASNKSKNRGNKGKKLKINSISELEFMYNDSQSKTTSTNKNMKLKKKNLICNTSLDKNSTDIISPKRNYNNKHFYRGDNQNKKKINQEHFDAFWENVKEQQKEKIKKINYLNEAKIKHQLSELREYPKISKSSIYLANNKERDALYLKRPFSEEKYLEEDFIKFYNKNLELTNIDKNNDKYIIPNEKKVKEKYDKIFKDNIKWKENKDKLNDKIRYDNIKRTEDGLKIYTFRPLLSQNTIQIIKKLNKNKYIKTKQYNNLYSNENERESLDKLRLKLKPVLSEVFDINNTKKPYISKKSISLANNLTDNGRRKRLNRVHSYQIIPHKKLLKDNKTIKTAKKEENKNDNIRENKYNQNKSDKKRKYEYFLLQKFREMKNGQTKKNKELYKLNVRQGTSWNQEIINYILPNRKTGFIIEGLL